MFAEFSVPVTTRALTLSAVQLTTGLDWKMIDPDAPVILEDTGVYVWIDPETGGMFYNGSGSGSTGLNARLSNQLRWRQNQLDRLDLYREQGHWRQAWDLASEVPAVRAIAERGLVCWHASAQPASWVPQIDDVAPETALEWEAFIMEVSHLAVGHRGIIGGGAWDAKRKSLANRMLPIAWDRMTEVANNWRN